MTNVQEDTGINARSHMQKSSAMMTGLSPKAQLSDAVALLTPSLIGGAPPVVLVVVVAAELQRAAALQLPTSAAADAKLLRLRLGHPSPAPGVCHLKTSSAISFSTETTPPPLFGVRDTTILPVPDQPLSDMTSRTSGAKLGVWTSAPEARSGICHSIACEDQVLPVVKQLVQSRQSLLRPAVKAAAEVESSTRMLTLPTLAEELPNLKTTCATSTMVFLGTTTTSNAKTAAWKPVNQDCPANQPVSAEFAPFR
mmetsp:Transcript_121128/g.220257  ORF Transcript_121128/g.220257 Transcript_121128/m.220257 type:complete len:254 (+) Transcript_121128:19-780(+)